jgi:hypothetical protein
MLLLQLTDAGLDAIVAAEAAGTASVVITELGLTHTAFDQAPTLTALPGEFKRIATVSGEVAAPNIIHIVAYDTSADAYDVTGMGLYLADGTLLATYTGADVAISKVALAFGLITFDIAFSTDVGATIAFTGALFNNPPATETTRGVVELATLAEAAAGVDALRALTPQGAKAAVLGWLLTQDGAGSDLDADLLDGRHAVDFLLAASYTAADVRAKLLTVDGAGSGIDADLLDGQDSTFFTNIVARLGFTPLNVTAYTAADVLAKLLTVDGAGSGIDADLLDGLNSNQFLRVSGASIGLNGYIKLSHVLFANDLIFQWCNVACTAGAGAAFNWPTPFPNALFGAGPVGKQGLTFSGSYSTYLSAPDLNGGTVYGNNGSGAASTVTIFALGN